MKFVIVESPYAGDVDRNVAYARAAVADCLRLGEAPFASHLLYTQPGILDDSKPEERERGINAGLDLASRADASVFYVDLGWSSGMERGFKAAAEAGRPMTVRTLDAWKNGSSTRELQAAFTKIANNALRSHMRLLEVSNDGRCSVVCSFPKGHPGVHSWNVEVVDETYMTPPYRRLADVPRDDCAGWDRPKGVAHYFVGAGPVCGSDALSLIARRTKEKPVKNACLRCSHIYAKRQESK